MSMSFNATTFGAAVLPAALLLRYFHRASAFALRPKVVWITLALGALVALPVAVVALAIDRIVVVERGYVVAGVLQAFVGAAVPEEIGKLLVILLYCRGLAELKDPMDGVVFGAAAALGFATLENLLYVVDGGALTAGIRAVTAVPSHAFDGAILGYFVGTAPRGTRAGVLRISGGLAIAVALHGVYDAPLLVAARHLRVGGTSVAESLVGGAAMVIPIGIVLLQWRVVGRMIRRLRAEQERTGQRAEVVSLSPFFDRILDGVVAVLDTPHMTRVLLVAGIAVTALGALGLILAVVGLVLAARGDVDLDAGAALLGPMLLVVGATAIVVARRRTANERVVEADAVRGAVDPEQGTSAKPDPGWPPR